MKTLAKLAVFVLLVLLALPIIKYRSINPCTMLKKERVERIRDGLEAAGEEVRDAVGEHSRRAEQMVEDVGAALEGLAEDLAERAAELAVEEMSARQCVVELWKTRRGN